MCDYPKCEDVVITYWRRPSYDEHGGSFAIRGFDTSTLWKRICCMQSISYEIGSSMLLLKVSLIFFGVA